MALALLMFPSMKSALLKNVTLALATFVLAACGNSFAPVKVDTTSEVVTGGFTPEGRPYTGIGDPAALERIKRMVPPTAPNRKLSQTMKPPVVARLGSDGKATNSTPTALDVTVTGADPSQELKFRVPVDGSKGTREVTSGPWELSVKCDDSECETTEMKLSKGDQAAAWVTTSRRVRVEVLGPFTSKTPTSAFNDVLSEFGRSNEATLVSHEIAWGASRFELKTKAMCISGAALSTGDQDAPAAIGCAGPQGVKASLSGNSTRGDLLIRVDDGAAWAFIRVRSSASKPPRPPVTGGGGGSTPNGGTGGTTPNGGDGTGGTTPPQPPQPARPGEQEPGSILPIDLSHKITEAFELDRTNEEVQERIRKWKKSPRMMSFLSKAPAKFNEMIEAMKGTGVPNEMVFVTFIESNYFTCPGFPVQVSPVGAVGPWQFMPKTAAWDVVGLKVKPTILVSSKQVKNSAGKLVTVNQYRADTDDERGDLAKSSRGGARYFKYLFTMFPSDPKLALMAYNWGPKGVDDILDCANNATCLKNKLTAKSLQHRLSAIQTAGFDYWTVRELNMAPKETLEYVVNFLSAQFVGRNPERYGMKVPTGDFTPPELGCPK